MRPEDLNQWVAIFRDVVIVLLAAFILSYETVLISNPNPLLVGAGLTLLGFPAAWRIDSMRRSRRNGDDDDNWSHLPR